MMRRPQQDQNSPGSFDLVSEDHQPRRRSVASFRPELVKVFVEAGIDLPVPRAPQAEVPVRSATRLAAREMLADLLERVGVRRFESGERVVPRPYTGRRSSALS